MDTNLQNEFNLARQEEKFSEFRISIITSAEKLIGPLFPVFWIADIIYAPDKIMEFLPIRLSVTAYCFFIANLSRKATTLKQQERLAILLLLYPALVITYLIFQTGGISSGYYAGLNLIAAGGIYFFPWTPTSSVAAIAAVYAPFVFLAPFSDSEWTEKKVFFVNVFFMAGNIVVALVIRSIYEALKKEEILTKINLKHEIQDRNTIIAEKTNEAVRISTLTKQFSPQVVHEISKGNLDLFKSHKRIKICAMFIDIVNSTDRVNRIDKDDLDKVITTFMEDTMKVLLKYDITIDKFLGDGVLAFSNAPLERPDYIERVLNAAIEIRERITINRDQYIQYWLNELEIRIGISVGYGNVGFYGSDEYFKSYTAIGRVVNMASRLCSSAEPNQILIDNDTCKSLDITKWQINDVGYRKLKGFEQDIIKVFQINKASTSSINHDIPICINGHGILHLDTNEKGIYELKCRTCGFTHDEALNLIPKKKAS